MPSDQSRPRALAAALVVVGLAWFLAVTVVIPAVTHDQGPHRMVENTVDLGMFALAGAVLIAYQRSYRASVDRELEARQAAQRRFRTMLDALPAAIIVTDDEGVIVTANGHVRDVLGYDTDELVGMSSTSLIANGGRTTGDSPGDLRFRSETGRSNARIHRRDGSSFPAEIERTPLDFDHRPRVMLTIEDVSERLRLEAERERRAASFRRLFADNPVPMWVVDPATLDFLEVNAAAIAKYGYSREEFLAMRMTDVIERDDAARPSPQVAPAPADARPAHEAARHRARTGEVIDVELDRHEILFEDRAAMLVAIEDVTDRKRAVEALQESESRFRQIAENIRECYWLRDLESQEVIYVSPAYEEIWGRPRPENPQLTPLLDSVHPEDRDRVAYAAASIRDTPGLPLECRIVRPDGSIRWLRAQWFPVRDASGRVYRIAGVAEDITDERELAARIQQYEKMEAIGQLASGIVHDFNNVLTGIRGFAELIRSTSDESDSRREDAHEIIAAVDHAADLTRKLVTFSRHSFLQPRTINLDELIAAVQPLLQRLVTEGVELVVSRNPELGSVRVDPVQMEQALLNLVANGRDAMPNGGTLTIATANVELDEAYGALHPAVVPGPYVRLSIGDTGVGMDDETRDRAFDPFFTTKPAGHGTGLGLSSVYGIVNQSGGHVEIETEPNRGTFMHLFLPRVGVTAETPAGPPQPPASIEGSERILVVEDNAAIRSFTARALRELGYDVLPAASPEEAVTIADRPDTAIDLLLTDIVMPGMSGYELAEHVRRRRPTTRVLLMSGYTEAVAAAGDPGAPFLAKPFSIESLGGKVREALDQSARVPHAGPTGPGRP